ncbi:hypothetical protein [Vibrio sp.]|uniref:hypothetical protein n=1 Tax=Vibrio sp. TaxID=678 RepID=UPI003D096E77
MAQENSDNQREVTVVDIRMPFWSMVVFLVKLAIASIPAMIILSFIFMILTMLFGGLGGMFHGVGMGRY